MSTSTSVTTSAPAVQKGCFHPRHPADFRGEGWNKDVHCTYAWYISITIDTTAQEADSLITPILRHMEWSRHWWHFVKEDDPLRYSVFLNDFFEEVHRYCLHDLDQYIEWINPRGWCHKVILHRGQLNYCKHLTGVEPPPEDMEGQASQPSALIGQLMRLPNRADPVSSSKRPRQLSWRPSMVWRRNTPTLWEVKKVNCQRSLRQSLWKSVAKLEQLQAMEVEMHLQVINMSRGKNKFR